MSALIGGFHVALDPVNLLYCIIGVVLGSLIGVLPGLGPAATIAILLPMTYNVPAEASVIMLAGIYYGAAYGGSTTSILMNLPGEASSVVTTLDGYQMAKQGRAGAALGISAIGSFIAGTIAVIGLSVIAPPMARFALDFGSPEYTLLGVTGIMLVVSLSGGSMVKGLLSAAFGFLLSTIGQDPMSGVMRFTFDKIQLANGINFVALVMGLFGIGEILCSLERREKVSLLTTKIKNIWPGKADLLQSRWAILRGSVVGFFLGILPGGGAVISSFASYSLEKKISRHPDRFGKGAIEGVAGPESSNNAASCSAFIPLLTLGIPSNAIMAMLYGALLIHGVHPGPTVIKEHPNVFWGLIDSMYIGNLFLVALNLPMVGLFVQLLRIRYSILAPIIILISILGVYSVDNRFFDVLAMVVFGVVGYLLRKIDVDLAPLVLAFILGPIIEVSFRRTMMLSEGSFAIFLSKPISVTLVAVLAVLVAIKLFLAVKKWHKVICDKKSLAGD